VIPEISRTASGSGFDPAEQAGKAADASVPNRIRDPKEPPHSTEEFVNKSVDSYELPEVKLVSIDTDTTPTRDEEVGTQHTPRQ
jgi:hypothetical protein